MRIPMIGGDPDLVRALVARIGEFRAAVDERYEPVDRGVGRLLGSWHGDAAERFFDRMQNQRPQIDAIAQDITTITEALNRFAADLDVLARAVADVQRRLDELGPVQAYLILRGYVVLLTDEAAQVRATLEGIIADADAARTRLADELRALAFFGAHGPDGEQGQRISAGMGFSIRGNSDWAGDFLFNHWRFGQGQHLVINNDPAWSDYMTANHLLEDRAGGLIEQEARAAISELPSGGSRPVVLTGQQANIQSGYATGYELLHSANVEERGGFEVNGTQTVTPLAGGGHEVRVVADYTWHDDQNPNLGFPADGPLASITQVATLGQAEDHYIDITWTREVVLRFDAEGQLDRAASVGWPRNPQ
jgi:uncharacterized protein YukE